MKLLYIYLLYLELGNLDPNPTPGFRGENSSYWVFDSSSVATFHTGNMRLHVLRAYLKRKIIIMNEK